MLDDLKQLVELESPSLDIKRLNSCADWLEGWVSERLGADIGIQSLSHDKYGRTLIVDIPPVLETSVETKVLLLGHFDTVWPAGTLDEMPFSIKNDTIRGPGVFDMKSGIIQAVWAIKLLRDRGMPLPSITFLLNPDEEVGSISSKDAIQEAGRNHDTVVVMEPSVDGALKTSRRGAGIFRADFLGREAHAGVEPEKGASAITALGEFIDYANHLASPKHGTSINVGIVNGGTTTNVVAGQAQAAIDIRIATNNEKARVEEAFRAFTPSDRRVRYSVNCSWNRPPMNRTSEIAQAFDDVRQVGRRLGLELKEAHSGGFSDGNLVAMNGKQVIDGFGAVGAGAHQREEHALVSGMLERTKLFALYLATRGDVAPQ